MSVWKDQNVFESLAFDDDTSPFTYLYIDNDDLHLWGLQIKETFWNDP